MKKRIVAGSILAAICTTYAAFMTYNLKTMDIETLIQCAGNDAGITIPSGICKHYLTNHRLAKKDIQDLTQGAGLDFILNSSSEDKYQIAELFIDSGLSVNSINHYSDGGFTPLHAAVIYNDAERVKYLLSKGAGTQIIDSRFKLTPKELATHLQDTDKSNDRKKLIQVFAQFDL